MPASKAPPSTGDVLALSDKEVELFLQASASALAEGDEEDVFVMGTSLLVKGCQAPVKAFRMLEMAPGWYNRSHHFG